MQADFKLFSKGNADRCRDDVELALYTFTAEELFSLCVEESKILDVDMRQHLRAGVCTQKGIKNVFERQVWRGKQLVDSDAYMHKAFDELEITGTDVINRTNFDKLIHLLRTADLETTSAQASAASSAWDLVNECTCVDVCIIHACIHVYTH